MQTLQSARCPVVDGAVPFAFFESLPHAQAEVSIWPRPRKQRNKKKREHARGTKKRQADQAPAALPTTRSKKGTNQDTTSFFSLFFLFDLCGRRLGRWCPFVAWAYKQKKRRRRNTKDGTLARRLVVDRVAAGRSGHVPISRKRPARRQRCARCLRQRRRHEQSHRGEPVYGTSA